MEIIYISSSRIPSELANTYQVLQMCEAFIQQGAALNLLYPQRDNTPDMKKVSNIQAYYGLQHTVPMTALPSFDLIWKSDRALSRFPRLLGWTQAILFRLLISSYSRAVLKHLNHHTANAYYLRDVKITRYILRQRPGLARQLFCEIHSLPENPKTRAEHVETLKEIGGVITITHQLRKLCADQGVDESHILVAPDGVNLERYQEKSLDKTQARQALNLPQDRYIVGYVGRLQTLGQEKGIPDLIKALAMLSQSRPSLNLALCCVGGPDDMVQQYRRFSLEQGLQPEQIIFTSSVPPAQVPLYLSAFDVCAMPFPWTQHYAYYMSPLKLFEYMASNRPILATRLPSVEEILQHEHNALLAQPGDPQSMAEGIARLAGQPALAQKLASQALQDVQAYTWTQRAANILAFMNEMIQP